MRPEFVDNREGNTLAAAIRGHLAWLADTYKDPVELSIASGYFNPAGFIQVADALEGLKRIRLLLGAEPSPPLEPRRRRTGEPRGERLRIEAFRKALSVAESGFRDDLNILGFTEDTDRTLRRLVQFFRAPHVEVRRYEKTFLHGKAFVFADNEGVIAGSSNFTGAGLRSNLELNLGHYQPTVVARVRDWFEILWKDAVPYDLASLYEGRYQEYPPYLVYLRALWERYGDELRIEALPSGSIPLTTFQNDGLARARRILDEYNGVLIADGVGLGKTFLVGEIIREAVQNRRQRALLVSPAALRDGTWRTFASRYQLYLENVSYEQLTDDPKLGGTGQSCLKELPDRYAVIVVDEAHAFRNPDTGRARALRRMLRGAPPKKLILATATPVNNSLWDLYYLLALFIGHDARFADLGIPSLKARFDQAMREDPYDLKPDVLFDLLDQLVVRRTRNFVRRYYPHDRIKLPDGTEATVRFPEPHVHRLDYDLEAVLPGFFDELAEALAPETEKLTMARYAPSLYRKRGKREASQEALVGLLRSALLKRFESSVHSFATTAERMAEAHDKFLTILEKGFVPTPELLAEWDEDIATEEDIDELIAEMGVEPVDHYDAENLRRDVQNDRDLLRDFARRTRKVTADKDPKLEGLTGALLDILAAAKKDALVPEAEGDLRKVLIFSYYSETVEWIDGYLQNLFEKDTRFAPYRGRIAAAAGRESYGGVSRDAAVFGFAPRSAEAPPGRDEDRFDVLVATDVLAEGLNLQQCRNVINFDLPWNPMRLVQRHGRIDRIGSPHADVFIGCFFPTERLDDLLVLEERLRQKIAQAAASIGVEASPLPGGATGEVVFADTRKEIEALRAERPDLFLNAGEDPHAHSGEEYRQELRSGLERWGEQVKALPWGAGSGLARGSRRGHFFCARVLDKVFFRFVPLDGGKPVGDSLSCISAIQCTAETPRMLPDDLLRAAYPAWQRARQDIFEEWSRATDPANLQPKIRPLFHEIANHLRANPPEGVTQEALEEALNSIEAPWGIRIERELRAVFAEGPATRERSARVLEKVRELGLTPYCAPHPLDPIDLEEVNVICWMAVERASETAAAVP